jgi:hypothetical protein
MRRRSATLEAESWDEFVTKSKNIVPEKNTETKKRATSLKKPTGPEQKSGILLECMYSIKESDENFEESPSKISKHKAQAPKLLESNNERGSIPNLLARLQSLQAQKDEHFPIWNK